MPTFAAIDIGSNSVRLSIAELRSGRLRMKHQDREVTRLGEGVFRNGSLDPHTMAHTIKVLQRFRRAIEKHSVDQVRVVATSAMRDAKNSKPFMDWVRNATGWELEVITGVEEGRLIHLGVMSSAPLRRSRVLLIDLGGGSCELTVSLGGHIREIVSLPLGAVRLTQDFLRHDPPREDELRRMHIFIAEELDHIAKSFLRSRVQVAIATSGTAAALTSASHRGKRAGTVTVSRVEALAKDLAEMDGDERKDLPGINAKRAEIIVAGSAVFAQVMRRLHVPAFRFSELGLRDGILAKMAAEYDARSRSHRQLESDREDAILALCGRYEVDLKHAQQVRKLVLTLFQQTRSVHLLSSEYQDLIAAAAMLHEVGYFVNRAGRHRHTYYVVSNSEIFGFTPLQREMIAAIARYMGNSKPVDSDAIMRHLPASRREDVVRAVCLLRLAKALNHGRRSAIRKVAIRSRSEYVDLKVTTARTGAELELWAAEKEVPYFREVFGRELLLKAS